METCIVFYKNLHTNVPNNLKQVLRLLFKEKRITIINIIGLS